MCAYGGDGVVCVWRWPLQMSMCSIVCVVIVYECVYISSCGKKGLRIHVIDHSLPPSLPLQLSVLMFDYILLPVIQLMASFIYSMLSWL